MKTGWPAGLLQDDCRKLSKWLANTPGARRIVRENLTKEAEMSTNPFSVKQIIDERNDALDMIRTVEILNAGVWSLVDDLRRELAGKDAEIAALTAERDHWKANHDAQVQRARLLIERTDMPVERVKAYEVVTALTAERDALRKDTERLDWLDQNIFSRENINFMGQLDPTMNMWVTFSPKGHQGSARNILDAAMQAQEVKPSQMQRLIAMVRPGHGLPGF